MPVGRQTEEFGEPTPSKLGRILKGAHDAGKTQRAIANTAKGRRIKAQQAKKEGKK